MNLPKTLGLILAGGLARRMVGGDKAMIAVGGKRILDRVLERLRPSCSAIVLNANGDPARFARYGLPVVADSVPGYAGPLAGILAGLDWAAAHAPEVSTIVSVPGDCPFIPRDLVRGSRLRAPRPARRSPAPARATGGIPSLACGRSHCARTCAAR
jgi:molybdopterin-guanine dinucleotide biosynthesis protein A